MLEKWHNTAMLLLTKEDLNTPVVFINIPNSIDTPENNDINSNTWKKIILENIEEFINKFELFTVLMYVVKDESYDIYTDSFYTSSFVDYYLKQIISSDGIKIVMTKHNGDKKTLIFIKK